MAKLPKFKTLPLHVAIIMDGNGRWAKRRGLSRIEGHRHGAKAVKTVVKTSRRLGIKYLTLYAFSTENWGRPQEEVLGLMKLLQDYIIKEREELLKNGIRLKTIGDLRRLPAEVRREIRKLIYESKKNSKMTFSIALSYGSREEILRAARRVASAVARGKLSPEEIDLTTFEKALYTSGIPDPDLLIRTSGELRLSNFLLWQAAYTEIYITRTLWPDFNSKELFKALKEFERRKRRFGLVW